MKRSTAVFLSLMMLFALLPTAALATGSDFTIENGVLTEYSGTGGNVVIPEGVTNIWDGVFYDCADLTSVTIPDSVTGIGDGAFHGCTSLTSVTIPDGVTWIGYITFDHCTNLTSVTIPSGVVNIGYCAFDGCTSLTDVYYNGTEEQWHTIIIDDDNDPLLSATIHYNSAANTAYPSTQTVEVDGKAIEFQCYALKDAAGNLTNYVKLRDVADALNGSAAQFEVGYYGTVNIATGWAYTPNGSEGSTPFSGQRECLPTTQKVNIDGKLTNLEAFTLTDDAGGGYTYYKLRDLGEAIGFKVDWTAERGIFIETK